MTLAEHRPNGPTLGDLVDTVVHSGRLTVGQAAAFLSETQAGKHALESARLRAEGLRQSLQGRAEGLKLQVQETADSIYNISAGLRVRNVPSQGVNIKGTQPTLGMTAPYISQQSSHSPTSTVRPAYMGEPHYQTQPLLDGPVISRLRSLLTGQPLQTDIVSMTSASPPGRPTDPLEPIKLQAIGGVSGANSGKTVTFPTRALSHGQRGQKAEAGFALRYD